MSHSVAVVPKGWTANVDTSGKTAALLRKSTNLTDVRLALAEVNGVRYVFQSGNDFYFWDCESQTGGKVKEPKTYDELLAQMNLDITKVVADVAFDT